MLSILRSAAVFSELLSAALRVIAAAVVTPFDYDFDTHGE